MSKQSKDHLRASLPIPDAPDLGRLITFDAKDPNTKFPPRAAAPTRGGAQCAIDPPG